MMRVHAPQKPDIDSLPQIKFILVGITHNLDLGVCLTSKLHHAPCSVVPHLHMNAVSPMEHMNASLLSTDTPCQTCTSPLLSPVQLDPAWARPDWAHHGRQYERATQRCNGCADLRLVRLASIARSCGAKCCPRHRRQAWTASAVPWVSLSAWQ